MNAAQAILQVLSDNRTGGESPPGGGVGGVPANAVMYYDDGVVSADGVKYYDDGVVSSSYVEYIDV